MKKTLLLICAGVTLAAASCKKDDDNKTTTPAASSRSELIKGTWTISEVGADANSNGTLDAGESTSAVGSPFAGTQTFNADGTGSINATAGSENFTWMLQDNDNTLLLISPGDTAEVAIKELSSNKLVEVQSNLWFVLTK